MPAESVTDPLKFNRKQKDRDMLRDPPQPIDLAERIFATQRKNASASRPRERVERPLPPQPLASSSTRAPPVPDKPHNLTPSASRTSPTLASPRKHQQTPHLVISRPSDTDPDDFSRRLKISTPPRPSNSLGKHHQTKLFNPETDPIPMRRTAEPESISDTTSSSYVHVPRGPSNPNQRDAPPRQLFDHRKDDPVRFSVLARPSSIGPNGRPSPTPKSSGEYVSTASTSSYAHSVTSSSFTLSSDTTGGSSASSALFDRPQTEESGNNAFAGQLKRLYRAISALETKILSEESVDEGAEESGRVVLKGRGKEVQDEDVEKQKWKKVIADHKRLAEMMHNLLEISLAPSVPASLRNIPTKYNIIIRLWTHGFHKLLESLRRASFSSALALEHLQDFIYYAYAFYTGLLEEHILSTFRSGWLEALGDLARYKMAVAAMVTGSVGNGGALTTAAVIKAASSETEPSSSDELKVSSAKSSSDQPAARIDDSPSPSIGLAAARLLDVEPEKEHWRGIARDWYGTGLTDTPGTGKLHHHLGLLSREVEGEEIRAVYHFVKSMTTLHPFPTSRESILPIWSPAAQARRALPDARVPELFVLLHGMLFTNIQLDDFQPTLARFLERLQLEGAEEREWIMMAVINIGSLLEYGRPAGLLKRTGGAAGREGQIGASSSPNGMRLAKRNVLVEEADKKMDVDEERANGGDDETRPTAMEVQASPPLSDAIACSSAAPEYPPSLLFAMQLAFSMLSQLLKNPSLKASPFARSTLNPYLTVILTFLATILKNSAALAILERAIPWDDLASFFAIVPRRILATQASGGSERWLTTGCAPPLPEDWCLRGMEWVGRRVYERGFWKSGEEKRAEIEVLDKEEGGEDLTDGIIEDEDDDEDGTAAQGANDTARRWVRIIRCGMGLTTVVDGFGWVQGTRQWNIKGALAEKVGRWKEEDRLAHEEEERRRTRVKWSDDAMDVDDEEAEGGDESSEESQDDENDSEEVKTLKARRRYLQSLLVASQHQRPPSPPVRRSRAGTQRKQTTAERPSLHIVPGYTVLVIDTNIVLSSLNMVSSIVESLRWTVIVPLPVVMELDGLTANKTPLGEAAQSAIAYIISHVRSHSTSLKVQTSKGNYLSNLNVRSEQVDFDQGSSWERNMDDLILKAAIWQDEHWVDRSALLREDGNTRDTIGAVKVVLLSLDRNLRLKARSRQLAAAGERDLASILATGT